MRRTAAFLRLSRASHRPTPSAATVLHPLRAARCSPGIPRQESHRCLWTTALLLSALSPAPAAAACQSQGAVGMATSSSAPAGYADDVQHLAVYGTLRDDDDSGALWTRTFLAGHASARAGEVEGASLFWSSEGNWPFAVLDPRSPVVVLSEARLEGASAPVASSNCVMTSDAAPLSRIHVRVLSWPTAAEFAAKLAEADQIEGYDAAHELSSEYVRRKVWVRVRREPQGAQQPTVAVPVDGTADIALQAPSSTPASTAAAAVPAVATEERVMAWLYVKLDGMGEVGRSNERMEHGDWMKRDRMRQPPKAVQMAATPPSDG